MHTIPFCLSPDGVALPTTVTALVIAGWAGRDAAAVEHHIEELALLGVPRPSATPLYYRVATDQLTTATELEFLGLESSGEAEAMILSRQDGLFVGLGSDHTDRALEAYSVAMSKQICPKPVALELWRFEEVADHWDALVLRSWATINGERVLYQEGTVASLLSPGALIDRYTGGTGLPPGTAMFCGTLPVLGGIRPAEGFAMELHDPVRKRTIRHGYKVRSMPVVS